MGSTNHNPNWLSTQGVYDTPELKVLFGEGGTKDLVEGREYRKVPKGNEFQASVRRYGRSKWALITFL